MVLDFFVFHIRLQKKKKKKKKNQSTSREKAVIPWKFILRLKHRTQKLVLSSSIHLFRNKRMTIRFLVLVFVCSIVSYVVVSHSTAKKRWLQPSSCNVCQESAVIGQFLPQKRRDWLLVIHIWNFSFFLSFFFCFCFVVGVFCLFILFCCCCWREASLVASHVAYWVPYYRIYFTFFVLIWFGGHFTARSMRMLFMAVSLEYMFDYLKEISIFEKSCFCCIRF